HRAAGKRAARRSRRRDRGPRLERTRRAALAASGRGAVQRALLRRGRGAARRLRAAGAGPAHQARRGRRRALSVGPARRRRPVPLPPPAPAAGLPGRWERARGAAAVPAPGGAGRHRVLPAPDARGGGLMAMRPDGPPVPKPYAAVPLVEGLGLRTDPGADRGHDRFTPDLLVGRLEGTCEALSPVHVGSGGIERTARVAPDLAAETPLLLPLVRAAGRPVLPGPTLKGAVRAVVEAV